ncbi:MAG TPA: molybdenum cofactor biosynthesis protein MoaE [bacterium]|nr:molybdenum cofactor biosynthesis protein MoaE [bacterium]
MNEFSLSRNPLDASAISALSAALASSHAGALVTFEGRVRDTNAGLTVLELEYEAYPALSLKEGQAVMDEATAQAGVLGARCVHRVGLLSVGDVAVWIGVLGGHREEAFHACRYIIDEVKRRVPIWKKERYADGSSGWIGAEGAAASLPSSTPDR